jgi:spore germination cell wall hydrolase CwlJ-like protein
MITSKRKKQNGTSIIEFFCFIFVVIFFGLLIVGKHSKGQIISEAVAEQPRTFSQVINENISIPEKTVEVDPKELKCLAEDIFFENRNNGIEGMINVAFVPLNRAEKENANICDVINEPYQFSYKLDPYNKVKNFITNNVIERAAYRQALNVSKMVLSGQIKDPTHGALYYHALYIDAPYWTASKRIALRDAVHIFYKDKD